MVDDDKEPAKEHREEPQVPLVRPGERLIKESVNPNKVKQQSDNKLKK